ncbi:MAG: universal stress protein [Kiloniellales bacterium]
MTPKAILVAIGGGEGSEAALRTALAVGKLFDSYVEVLHVRADSNEAIPIMAEGLSGAVVQELIDSLEAQAERRAKAAEVLFKKCCVDERLAITTPDSPPPSGKLSARLKVVTGRPDDVVGRAGRLFDLIVVERPPEEEDSRYPLVLEAALFDSGRPILLAPSSAPATVGKRIVVIWNNTKESAEALAAVLPFGQQAESLQVLTVKDGITADPAEVKSYLALHDITAEAVTLEPDHRPLGEQLLKEAEARDADLLVMGAYGHSRLREMVLGGVTRSVVGEAAVPVLMAH